MGNALSQMYPPKPTFTEEHVGDLQGKVYIVTGSNTGVGKELARLLYLQNATVYIAARSQDKSLSALEDIKKACPSSKGQLTFLKLDLADLTTIKPAVEDFLSKETKLNVLFLNAGVMYPPEDAKTVQGHDMQLGTNCLGHFLLAKLLTPLLISTAKEEPTDSVRIVWVSSSATELLSHKPGGLPVDNLDYHVKKSNAYKYGVSKAGNFLHAKEHLRRFGEEGVVSVSLNPGNLDSDLPRHLGAPAFMMWILRKTFLHKPVMGGYTELFAGLSPEMNREALRKWDWVIPFGRLMTIRKDIQAASKPSTEGGTGVAEKWWQWSEEQVAQYA